MVVVLVAVSLLLRTGALHAGYWIDEGIAVGITCGSWRPWRAPRQGWRGCTPSWSMRYLRGRRSNVRAELFGARRY